MGWFDFLAELDALNAIGWLLSDIGNKIAVVLGGFIGVILYPLIVWIDEFYTLMSFLYSATIGLANLIISWPTWIQTLMVHYWPSEMPAMLTFLMLVSIAVANAQRVFKVLMWVWRNIPFIGGR